MHSAAIAEWILSLVAPPDRAASTVGDLVEEASSRGTIWFWSCVLRTAGSHLWHDLNVSPLWMFGRGLWGVAASWVLSLLFMLLLSIWLQVDPDQFGQLVGTQRSPREDPMAVVAIGAVCSFLVGWEVGRRSAGRELPAALSVATLFAAIYGVNQYRSLMQVHQIGITWSGMEQHAFATHCAQALFVIAGAILFRRRHCTANSRARR